MRLAAPKHRSSFLLGVLLGTSSGGVAVDAALVAARVVLAWVFIFYGGMKLFGWFPGSAGPHGIHQTTLYFSQQAGLHPGGFFAVLGGITEFGGGIAMGLGIFTRLAGTALFADMVIAMITITWATGIDSINSPPGYQLNIAVGVLALVVALVGAGRFSLDALLVRRLQRHGGVETRKAVTSAPEDSETHLAS